LHLRGTTCNLAVPWNLVLVSDLSSIPKILGWWRVIPNLDRYSTRMEPPKNDTFPFGEFAVFNKCLAVSIHTVPALQPGRS
jgi:hypothetical protein